MYHKVRVRDWTPEQQHQLMDDGRVEGYIGHHMKSVSSYPQQAGNSGNIQFLSENEHFEGAHQGSFHNQTNGYYNPNSGSMEEFNGSELRPVESQDLSVPCYENGEHMEQNEQSESAFKASAKNSGQESSGEANSFNNSVKQSNSTEEGQNPADNKQSVKMSR